MSMTTTAYLRVSTGQQSIDQQHDAIAAAGIAPDRVFTGTASGRAERRASREAARVARRLAAIKPMKLDAAQQKRLLRLYQQGEPVSELTAMFGVSRSTLFRTLKVLKLEESVSA